MIWRVTLSAVLGLVLSATPALAQRVNPPVVDGAVPNAIKRMATVDSEANNLPGAAVAAFGPNSPLALFSSSERVLRPPPPFPGTALSRAFTVTEQIEPVSNLPKPMLSANTRSDVDLQGMQPFASFRGRSWYDYIPAVSNPNLTKALWVHLLVQGVGPATTVRGTLADGSVMKVSFGPNFIRVRAVDGPAGPGTLLRVEGVFPEGTGDSRVVQLGDFPTLNHFFIYEFPAAQSIMGGLVEVAQGGTVTPARPSASTTLKKHFYTHSWLMWTNRPPKTGPYSIKFYAL